LTAATPSQPSSFIGDRKCLGRAKLILGPAKGGSRLVNPLRQAEVPF
jgi:hypothetical protein